MRGGTQNARQDRAKKLKLKLSYALGVNAPVGLVLEGRPEENGSIKQ